MKVWSATIGELERARSRARTTKVAQVISGNPHLVQPVSFEEHDHVVYLSREFRKLGRARLERARAVKHQAQVRRDGRGPFGPFVNGLRMSSRSVLSSSALLLLSPGDSKRAAAAHVGDKLPECGSV